MVPAATLGKIYKLLYCQVHFKMLFYMVYTKTKVYTDHCSIQNSGFYGRLVHSRSYRYSASISVAGTRY